MKAFIFDMDGVIVDSEPLHSRVKMETFEHFGLHFDAGELEQYMGRTSADIFSDVLAREHRTDVTAEEIADYKHHRYLELVEEGALAPIPGSLALIGRLQEYKDALDAGDAERLHDLLAEGDRLKREAEGR